METVVKLSHQSVIGEIESVLDTYLYEPYQQAFAIPDLRQELISFVINRLPGFYSAVPDSQISIHEDEQNNSINQKLPRHPLGQHLHLQNLIHQGIFSIIQQKSDWISNHLRETVQPGCQPSHWFG
ncbi:hypothetical protein H6G54_01590 [Anabaena cylindrica FACHB-243]|uniref:Uncharacterized protein n=1 Tax=Anabaena cylindrica (strain ATCC 27899 / PCC 7122) TaxID=272123 RepID=K9ZNS1_ANACC|nr:MULTISPECIES: hypothetical protein [Anabaena]AFZ60439.1 hypothetical protein Anacy_5104 [Anabaena cylindrica PCC 7122]MBD2416426.1 hypothetical protein [Anabaena cylindrica FACHB-243]MBY5280568.1 hypothetical protein [Anabaena sp. CCAP 1446/1C]MBY5309053.1 hypothetical protein [Anabaena sp. CCAP 1446/1C]MCM2408479.1 hypothetical protein [Anabaena sp. CCAP 1446/1C]